MITLPNFVMNAIPSVIHVLDHMMISAKLAMEINHYLIIFALSNALQDIIPMLL